MTYKAQRNIFLAIIGSCKNNSHEFHKVTQIEEMHKLRYSGGMRNWHAICRLILLQHLLVLASLEIPQTYWLELWRR